MRDIHRVRTGGTGRHPSVSDQLYVGQNTRGKRGGLSGNPVDAVCVANGVACASDLVKGLDEQTLIRLAAALGRPLDGREVKRLEKMGATDDLRAHILIARLGAA